MKEKKVLKMLSALAQENRLAIYRLLIQEKPEGLSAGTIADILHISPATLSFHLSQLQNAGLIKSTKMGRTILYAAKYKTAKRLFNFLSANSYRDTVLKRQKKLRKIKIDEENLKDSLQGDESDDEY